MGVGDILILLGIGTYCAWVLLRKKKPGCGGNCTSCAGCGKQRKG